MAQQSEAQAQPEVARAQPVAPLVLPDVTNKAHPASPAEPNLGDNSPEAGDKKLEDVLPEINEVARKVGGFKKLADIADTLHGMGK